MNSLGFVRSLSLRVATASAVGLGSLVVGVIGCASLDGEDVGSGAAELRSHASEAGLYDWSDVGRGVIAVANDRWLSVDDLVFRARIPRVMAEALVHVRNGNNGDNESRPVWWWGGGSSGGSTGPGTPSTDPSTPSTDPSSSSSGSSPYPGPGPSPYPPYPCSYPPPPPPPSGGTSGGSSGGSSGSSSTSGGPVVVDGGSWPPPPPPPVCRPTWQIGGDDEEFSRLGELDALPGSDVSAFHNLRDFAIVNGYVQPTHPWPTDAGTPPSRPDGGGPFPTLDAGGPRPRPDGGGSIPRP